MADEGTTGNTEAKVTVKEPEAGKQPEVKPLGPEGEKALEAWKDRAKKAEKEAKEASGLRERLQKIEDENKSETDKALDKARKETRAEAEAEFEKERRADRLQVAVAGFARELADVDDVVLNLERDGTDDLFTKDGRVDSEALKSALETKLKQKPHLRAATAGKPQGSADGGEGEGGEGRSFNDLLRAG